MTPFQIRRRIRALFDRAEEADETPVQTDAPVAAAPRGDADASADDRPSKTEAEKRGQAPRTPVMFRFDEIADGLDSDDWGTRLDAVQRLAGIRDAKLAVPSLLERLRDPAAEVAVAAARGLGSQRATSAVEPLREVLRNAEGFYGASTRQAALAALCEIVGAAALPDLRAAVGDLDADVARAAIQLIATHGTTDDGQALQAVVDDRRGFFHPSVRAAAADALQQLSA